MMSLVKQIKSVAAWVFGLARPARRDDATSEPIQFIVHAYGRVLETTASSIVSDVSLLPASKETIKHMLKAAALLNDNDMAFHVVLGAGFVRLATFQANVGHLNLPPRPPGKAQ